MSSASTPTRTGSSAWRHGDSYVEDITDERLAGALASGRYEPTADPSRLAGFDIAVIDVPTPLSDGSPNLSFVVGAADDAGPAPQSGSHGGARVDQLSGDH